MAFQPIDRDTNYLLTPSLGAKARERFGCRIDKRVRIVPSESTLRDVLIRADPVALDRALARWNADYGPQDQSLAIDGKTLCNAIDEEGRQTHIMGVVGPDSSHCYTQKKSASCAHRGKGRGQANQ